jgi:endogenous inhibitor of DNA gyrase (YacG/DUF329 family)
MTEIKQEASRACAQCGAPMESPGPQQLYCSSACKNRMFERRHPERALRRKGKSETSIQTESETSIQTRCQRCGEPIPRSATRPKLYCSSSCQVAASRTRAAEQDTGEWIPEPGINHGRAPVQRRHLIRSWAEQGYSSRQMSERLGNTAEVVRRIAKEIGVVIPADQVISNTRHHDSASIIRETAQALEGLVMGIGLVNLDDVDPAEAKAWATSLSGSLRLLNQFANHVKEMTQ